MRKLLLLFLLAVMPLYASAQYVNIDGISYYLTKTMEAEVVYDYNNHSGLVHVDIPASITYEGVNYSVVRIGGGSFEECTRLSSITIPNSVTSIGIGAFRDCSSLTSITIPYGVTTIEDNTFKGCNALTSVTIPNSVTSIGESSFEDCSSLTSIEIPNSVMSMGYRAFKGCSGLTSITISNSLASIRAYVFEGCSGLTSVTIPNSVTKIDLEAFAECRSLTSITIPNSVTEIVSRAFLGCSSLTSVTIPKSVTSIEASVFSGCSSLASVSIPNSVTSIGDNAFYGCRSLTSITIPNSVTNLGHRAFSDCRSLTSIAIPNSVKTIGNYAFSDCRGLTSVTIPNSLTSITPYFFENCINLTSITIPNSVTSIGEYAFSHCSGLTSVTIPNSVTSIGNHAFEWCKSLTSITIPNGVTTTEWGVFYGCRGLTSVTIPNSVTIIGSETFKSCSSLASITIPNSVTSIGSSAFEGCSSLSSITIPNRVTSIDLKTFYNCSSLTSITIPNGVTSIRNSAFSGCSSLTSITIPDGVTSIGSSAFSYCSSLTSLTIPNGVTSIEPKTFFECSSLTSITISNNVTFIGSSAFDGCIGLTSVTIPNSVTSIGNDAFYGCSGLTSATIGNSVTSIGNNAFKNCSSLMSITIPNGVTNIEASVFYGCSSLTSVTIPNGVTSIGNNAFRYCSGLTDFVCLATEVPTTGTFIFTSAYLKNVVLHIPEESIDKYAAVEPWKNFKEIKVIAGEIIDSSYDVNNDGKLDEDDLKGIVESILGRADGTDVLNNVYDANNDGKIDITDIVQLLGLSNDIKEGRLPDIDEENEGGFVEPTEMELQIMQMLSNEDEADEIKYALADSLEYDALAKEVISKYNTDDDSDYDVTDINKTRASYDDLAKAAIRNNGDNIFEKEENNGGKPKLIIEHKTWNSKNWGNTRYGGFKTFYNTLKKDGKRYLLVVFYKEGGFPNKKMAYLKLGQLNSGKIIDKGAPIYTGQEYAFICVCIDDYIKDYGCFNVFPLLITEESKARNYRNPIFVQSDPFVDVDWREKHNGDEFGRINSVSVYCNTSPQKKNEGGDGYIYQCVELCRRYLTKLYTHLKLKYNDTWGDAIDWPKYRADDPHDYLVFANDGRERVREGDLIVWKHGTRGHIGVVIKTEADKIIVAHQNGGAGLLASPIGSEMKLVNGIIKDIAPGTNRSPIFGTIQSVPYFIRVNNVNEHITPYNASMKASTTNMAFSSAQVGKSITQTFIINNPKGMDKLEISSITLSRGDAFSVDVTNCSIEPGDAKVVRVTFTPSASGEYKDRIIIKSNADDNPTWAIHLTGSGI